MVNFKNLGHAIASGAKHFEDYAKNAVAFLAKVKGAEPAVELILKAVAPQATEYADLAFHALGDIVAAIEKAEAAGVQVGSAATANGLNVQMDLDTINAIKAAGAAIKSVVSSIGAQYK